MRVLIAPDKFKGSLTAAEVANHVAKGLAAAGATTRTLPLADGGDGSVAAALAAEFDSLPVTVHGATGQAHRSVIAFDPDTAIVEVANTCGLATLPGGILAPMTATSYGFGEAVAAALTLSRHRLVLALGGSASTDGGIGMLAALGYRFLDRSGGLLAPTAGNLGHVHRIDSHAAVELAGVEVIVAGDVTSPLLGPTGAAAVFGPQKGVTAAQVASLDHGLENLVGAFTRSGFDTAEMLTHAAGSGAAGGIGFAAMLLGAATVSGAKYFLDLLDFDGLVADADLVITGEGRLDEQTLQGKLPAAVALRSAPTPVIAVVGRNDLDVDVARTHFVDVFAVSTVAEEDTSRDPHRTAELLQRIGNRIGAPGRRHNASAMSTPELVGDSESAESPLDVAGFSGAMTAGSIRSTA